MGVIFFEEMGVNVPNISPVQCFISCNGWLISSWTGLCV